MFQRIPRRRPVFHRPKRALRGVQDAGPMFLAIACGQCINRNQFLHALQEQARTLSRFFAMSIAHELGGNQDEIVVVGLRIVDSDEPERIRAVQFRTGAVGGSPAEVIKVGQESALPQLRFQRQLRRGRTVTLQALSQVCYPVHGLCLAWE